jgi:hypothetical protein
MRDILLIVVGSVLYGLLLWFAFGRPFNKPWRN